MKYFSLLSIALFLALSCGRNEVSVHQQSCRYKFVYPQVEAQGSGDSFTVSLDINFSSCESPCTILDVPGVLQIVRRNVPSSEGDYQNYTPYADGDGVTDVLEARLDLEESIGKGMIVLGVPVSLLDPLPEHRIVFDYDSVKADLFVDGRLFDSDFVFGHPACFQKGMWFGNASDVRLYSPSIKPLKDVDRADTCPQIQFWSPPYHNAWVGDVVSCFFKGRYHIFYLFDRRGHKSKLGKGGHYFAHLSTSDFKTWEEHEAAVPITEQYQSIGTGSPLQIGDSLYLCYGLHTERFHSKPEMTVQAQMDSCLKRGFVEAIRVPDDYPELVPGGSFYAVSSDGINFEERHVQFHYCRNPCVKLGKDDSLTLYASNRGSGTWRAASLNGPWTCVDSTFPPGGDCTFFHQWGDWEYLWGGFDKMWYRRIGETKYRSMTADGLDVYDGLQVPDITALPDGRRVIAGWVRDQFWGGLLCIRELIQYPDGTLGIKWMDEVTPRDSVETFVFSPEEGRASVLFPSDGINPSVQWQFDFASLRSQFADLNEDGSAPQMTTVGEGNKLSRPCNYAVYCPKIDASKPLKVRMRRYQIKKCGFAFIDVEIDGCRTMVGRVPYSTL